MNIINNTLPEKDYIINTLTLINNIYVQVMVNLTFIRIKEENISLYKT